MKNGHNTQAFSANVMSYLLHSEIALDVSVQVCFFCFFLLNYTHLQSK